MPSEPSKEAIAVTVMLKAAEQMDWDQVVGNGGPPCFFLEGERFCGRAERWFGHTDKDEFPEHRFVSLLDLLAVICDQHISTCMFHRCSEHLSVPQINATEFSGSECGACIRAELQAQRDLTKSNMEMSVSEHNRLTAELQAAREEIIKWKADTDREWKRANNESKVLLEMCGERDKLFQEMLKLEHQLATAQAEIERLKTSSEQRSPAET